MKLELYLRNKLSSKIRPLFIKEQCEICGRGENLHLHHIHLFSEILKETLIELNLDYKDTLEYTDTELSNISNIILGKHVSLQYITVCNICHRDEHKEDWGDIVNNEKRDDYYKMYWKTKEYKTKIYIENIIIPHLEKVKERQLLRPDQDILKEKFRGNGFGKRTHGINSIKEIMKENNIPFEIESGRDWTTKDKKQIKYRYWLVNKL